MWMLWRMRLENEVTYASLEMVLQKVTHNSYSFCCISFILVKVLSYGYFIRLNISGSVLVTPIDRGYDFLEDELFM